jgi:hypothetical protein
MVAVPTATPAITPLLSTVATPTLLLLQVPPMVELTNVVVLPIHTPLAPVIAVTIGLEFIVTSVVFEFEQPLISVYKYVIVEVPEATPETKPEALLTVALDGVEELQTPAVNVLFNNEVVLSQIVVFPVIAGITGKGFTVNCFVVAPTQPLTLVTV